MAEKPRTASNGTARLGLVDLDKLGPGLRRTVLALVDAEVRKEIRKAQAELLADGWTFLPGEMQAVYSALVESDAAPETVCSHGQPGNRCIRCLVNTVRRLLRDEETPKP